MSKQEKINWKDKKMWLFVLAVVLFIYATKWYGDYRVEKSVKNNEHFLTCGELVNQESKHTRSSGYIELKIKARNVIEVFQTKNRRLPSAEIFFGSDKSDFNIGDDVCVEWINHDYIIKPKAYSREIYVVDIFKNSKLVN